MAINHYIFPEPYQGQQCSWSIQQGDALKILRKGLLHEFFPWGKRTRCWITSPPYFGQVDYELKGQIGWEPTVEEYINKLVQIAYEMRWHSADDANMFMVIRDSFNYSGGPGGDNKRANGSLKKKPRKGPREPGVPPQALLKIPARLSVALEKVGWWLKQDIIWNKQDALSAAPRRLSYSHEHLLHFVLDPQISYFNREAVLRKPADSSKGQLQKPYKGHGQHNYKAIQRENPSDKKRRVIEAMQRRNGNCLMLDVLDLPIDLQEMLVEHWDEFGSVWDIPSHRSPKIDSMPDYYHRAPFPLVLAEMCVLFGSEPGDWIGDPFCGSGTTLVAALKHGRNAFGIELNPTDVKAMEARIRESENA